MSSREPIYFDDYEEAKRHWSSCSRATHKGVEKELSHLVDATNLIIQLRILHSQSGDQRFEAAVAALYENGFVVGSEWADPTPYSVINGVEDKLKIKAVRIIEALIEHKDISPRLAYATCAANTRWPGNSFEAAVKALERLHRANRRAEE